ncbi:MAG: DUF488 family protein [Alphaproteobacteria bacterium]|nr:DUF488 family protein [Alphaproteobacteria bacterium]MBU6474191.1 DUF488 family protein [Alphaproteobacteria bacterium]MDE2011361.1 DUF488 family protein [Alphaproteobacteria bacterium]MDE2072881.1 DUF488 family protein [Alphaproteobacteria bacterium]MDE2353301.1 DUF488 family protein [Alphaproteobacteria bacterium]
MGTLSVKRVYEPRQPGGGADVLVDRIWPRGVRKEDLKGALWLKELAPSTALRQWFGHEPGRWTEFCKRYWSELDAAPEPVNTLRALLAEKDVTLLYSARDPVHNQAQALKKYLERHPQRAS